MRVATNSVKLAIILALLEQGRDFDYIEATNPSVLFGFNPDELALPEIVGGTPLVEKVLSPFMQRVFTTMQSEAWLELAVDTFTLDAGKVSYAEWRNWITKGTHYLEITNASYSRNMVCQTLEITLYSGKTFQFQIFENYAWSEKNEW